MGKMSREKGERGEREAAKFLREVLNVEARRGRQYSGGPESPDVKCEIPGIHFEVKRVERFNLYKAMDQAQEDAGEGDIPVVLHRKNRKNWIIALELTDIPALVRTLLPYVEALEADNDASPEE